jgi:hypothetical protein
MIRSLSNWSQSFSLGIALTEVEIRHNHETEQGIHAFGLSRRKGGREGGSGPYVVKKQGRARIFSLGTGTWIGTGTGQTNISSLSFQYSSDFTFKLL